MPRLHPQTGRALCGIAGTPGSLDGQPIPLYEPQWLTDALILGRVGSDATGYAIVTLDATTGEVAPVAPYGAVSLVAGGGRWLGWSAERGMVGSVPNALAFPYAAHADGTLAWKPGYHDDGGLLIEANDAPKTRTAVPDAVVRVDVQLLGPGAAVWVDTAGLRAIGRAVPRPALPPDGPRVRVASASEEDWLAYWKEGVGLIAQIDGAPDGYVLERQPIAFYHEIVAVNGTARVAWCMNQGERVGSLVVVEVTRAGARFLTPADRPAPQRQPLRAAVDVPRIGRPLWLGPFEMWVSPGSTSFPQNCSITVPRDPTAPRWLSSARGVIAQFIAGDPEGDLDALERALADATRDSPTVTTLAYWPPGLVAQRVPRGADWLGVEAYWHVTETLEQFADRISGAIARAAPRPVVVIAQVYTSNATNRTDLLPLVPVYATLAIAHPNVVGIIAFSAGARATGWEDHPEVHAAWRQLAAGIPAAPAWPPAPPPVPVPAPVPPHPPPPIPRGDLMAFAKLDTAKVILYKQLKPAAQAGTVNVILPDDRVLSAHGDDRDPGTDGPWEQGQVAGQAVVFRADNTYWPYLILPVDKLP